MTGPNPQKESGEFLEIALRWFAGGSLALGIVAGIVSETLLGFVLAIGLGVGGYLHWQATRPAASEKPEEKNSDPK